ncbi:hypothetical protein CKAH01_08759 [Colletotrichum kahawae]|uniref:Secreted protein n=1 Tax=Colletotrichum kahawae TaxID=34407 RepID=A0AAD9Y1J8_COLKA|nr:hypothetical protein CKAH01_08759 [Colletotrichum kahawae]
MSQCRSSSAILFAVAATLATAAPAEAAAGPRTSLLRAVRQHSFSSSMLADWLERREPEAPSPGELNDPAWGLPLQSWNANLDSPFWDTTLFLLFCTAAPVTRIYGSSKTHTSPS